MPVDDSYIPGVQTPEGALRHVRENLREARHEAQESPGAVARKLNWPLSRVLKIEQSCRPAEPDDVAKLLDHYRFSAEAREHLLGLARRAAR
ncbi:helix-turn-helix domain-containing protein [Kineosporia mesophila]|uniref:helix-turn-helix domain-containing protein n=1 Tax=Kineosporia mesophila TaxID=566012 RepID=UPI0038B28597